MLDRLLGSLSIRALMFHPATLFVVVTAGLIAGAIGLWEAQKHDRLEVFQLTQEKIRLTPQPQWATDDLRDLVTEASPNTTPSILDTQLVARTASVMRNVGFVEQVRSVKKSKSGLDIDLIYRQPVALVELSSVTIPAWTKSKNHATKLLPVDRHGVLMPLELNDGVSLPKIMIPYPAAYSNLQSWGRWPDERVSDAAAICALFKSTAQTMGLALVVQDPTRHKGSQVPFDLRFDSGVIIIWGNAPGKELISEADAETKLHVIDEIVSQYGSQLAMGKKVIDIRTGQPIIRGESKTATNPTAKLELK